VWSNPDRARRKGEVFRAFVCPHISGRDSCVYSMGLHYRGHFSQVLEGTSLDWCHGNELLKYTDFDIDTGVRKFVAVCPNTQQYN